MVTRLAKWICNSRWIEYPGVPNVIFFKANLVGNEAALVWVIYGRVEGEKGHNEREQKELTKNSISPSALFLSDNGSFYRKQNRLMKLKDWEWKITSHLYNIHCTYTLHTSISILSHLSSRFNRAQQFLFSIQKDLFIRLIYKIYIVTFYLIMSFVIKKKKLSTQYLCVFLIFK